jgi:hypothetical protein
MLDKNFFAGCIEIFEPGLGGVVSLEPQPFLQCREAAPKSRWVMVEALWYRPSDRLGGLRLLRGRFGGKGAIGGRSPFPVAGSPETTPPVLGSNSLCLRAKACIGQNKEDVCR